MEFEHEALRALRGVGVSDCPELGGDGGLRRIRVTKGRLVDPGTRAPSSVPAEHGQDESRVKRVSRQPHVTQQEFAVLADLPPDGSVVPGDRQAFEVEVKPLSDVGRERKHPSARHQSGLWQRSDRLVIGGIAVLPEVACKNSKPPMLIFGLDWPGRFEVAHSRCDLGEQRRDLLRIAAIPERALEGAVDAFLSESVEKRVQPLWPLCPHEVGQISKNAEPGTLEVKSVPCVHPRTFQQAGELLALVSMKVRQVDHLGNSIEAADRGRGDECPAAPPTVQARRRRTVPSMTRFHELTMRSITGDDVEFSSYQGTVCLVVNVASY